MVGEHHAWGVGSNHLKKVSIVTLFHVCQESLIVRETSELSAGPLFRLDLSGDKALLAMILGVYPRVFTGSSAIEPRLIERVDKHLVFKYLGIFIEAQWHTDRSVTHAEPVVIIFSSNLNVEQRLKLIDREPLEGWAVDVMDAQHI